VTGNPDEVERLELERDANAVLALVASGQASTAADLVTRADDPSRLALAIAEAAIRLTQEALPPDTPFATEGEHYVENDARLDLMVLLARRNSREAADHLDVM
jgi:hypothetical protein